MSENLSICGKNNNISAKIIHECENYYPRDILFDHRNKTTLIIDNKQRIISLDDVNSSKCDLVKCDLVKYNGKLRAKKNKLHRQGAMKNMCIQPATNNILISHSTTSVISVLSNYEGKLSSNILYNINCKTENIRYGYDIDHIIDDVDCAINGNMYVLTSEPHDVKIYNEKGNHIGDIRFSKNCELISCRCTDSADLCIDKNTGRMFVSNNTYNSVHKNTIGVIDVANTYTLINTIKSAGSSFRCFTTDNYGNLIIADAHNMYVYDSRNYKKVKSFSCRGVACQYFPPDKICTDDENNILMCSLIDKHIVKISNY